ncbi:MAG: hypothetical protein K2O06_05855 [Acetatifactor sp.]|nr:hypothetical protein [Acetatifactor sp.]
MKKILAIFLAIVMPLAMLTACGDPGDSEESKNSSGTEQSGDTANEDGGISSEVNHPTDPLEMITDGFYSYGYSAEGYGDFTYFFHFYEEDPVLGSVYYAGLLNNGVQFAGLYSVEEKECAYECYPDRDEAVKDGGTMQTGTAPYTVYFYDWQGNLVDQCAYDGEILYNDLEAISAMASGPVLYHHDIAGEASSFAGTYEGEIGVPYLAFVGVEDELATLSLSHNRTYVDLVDTIIEGTWEISDNADGGYDYTLVTNAGVEDAVISVSADTKTAVYTKADGSLTLNMVNSIPDVVEEAGRYTGTSATSYGVDAVITLITYVDNTARMTIEIYGNEGELDSGTYTVGEDGTITFQFDNAGEVQSEGGTVHYVTADYDSVLTREGAEVFLVLAGEGGMAAYEGFTFPENLTFYSDGTCELTAEIQGEVSVLATGTYTLNEFGIPESATLDTLGEIAINIDYTTMLLSAEIPAIEEAGFSAVTVSISLQT